MLGKNKADLIKLVNAKNKDGNFYVQREVRYEGYRIVITSYSIHYTKLYESTRILIKRKFIGGPPSGKV